MKPKPQELQTRFGRVAPRIGLYGSAVAIIFFVANLLKPEDAMASYICGATITSTVTVSSDITCTGNVTVDGGTLYVEASVVLRSKTLLVENGGVVYIRNGGNLNARLLQIRSGGYLSIAGNVDVDRDFVVRDNGSEAVISEGYTVNVGRNLDIWDNSKLQVAGTLNYTGGTQVALLNGATLEIQNHGTVDLSNSSPEFVVETTGATTTLDVQPGGWLFVAKMKVNGSSVIFNVDGYVEQTSSSATMKIMGGASMTGSGVFYCLVTSKLSLLGGATVFGIANSGMVDDMFILGLDTIRVKRLPQFKIEESGWVLGDSLVVTDTLDLNGFSLDIDTFDFKLPKSFSFRRTGSSSEYIATTRKGRYNMEMLANNTPHTAPIGRNPYLPVIIECANCQGVEFALAVTENLYLNPEQLAYYMTSDAVGEMWTITPDQTFSGSITFTLQWNAGGSGTNNSELTGFSRTDITSYYWIDGVSSAWANDGVNVKVAASGSDPYMVDVTLSGMTGGVDYYFGVANSGATLPVEFSYFGVIDNKGVVELIWETATELNNDYFEVQRSANGMEWEDKGSLKGAGTSVSPNTYSFYDYTPEKGINYYRIKQVDFDETTDYSEVRTIKIGAVEEPAVLAINGPSPNPFDDFIRIEYTSPIDADAIVELIDLNGNVVYHQMEILHKGSSDFTITGLDGLSAGQYHVRVRANGMKATEMVLKQ